MKIASIASRRYSNSTPYNASNSSDKTTSKREVSVRTLFVRNIDFQQQENDLKDLFSKYGEVKRVFLLTEKKGIAFVTFFDIRAAEIALKQLNNCLVGQRNIQIEYSTPKGDLERNNRCGEDDNQGTLFVTFSKNMPIPQVSTHFNQYGEILGIRNLKVITILYRMAFVISL